jgi:hypothetical protein
MAITISGGSAGTTIIEGNDGGAQLTGATGAFTIPVGTTAQRPGTPATGMLRLNTTGDVVEVYNGTAWVAVGEQAVPLVVDFLVIAGGGGSSAVAGGGAGGYRCSVTGELSGGGGPAETELTLTTETNYTVTVGGGGAGQTIGSDSVFSTITSTGGGRAGIQNTANNVGGTGGSGGGSAYPLGGTGNVYSGGLGTANQGFDGGGHAAASGGAAGGGGGAGAVGTANTSVLPGNGGNGVAFQPWRWSDLYNCNCWRV